MNFFTPDDIKKYFYASCMLAVFCLLLAILAISQSGEANTIQQTIVGTGDLYTRHDASDSSDLAIVDNATVRYEGDRNWGNSGDDPKTLDSSVIVSGAKGGYQNQYRIESSAIGYKHSYTATQIYGDFSGSGEISITVDDAGATNLDSLVLMDGNATFKGRIYSSGAGKPITSEETDAIGQFIIRSYLNITEPIEQPDDWLGFCDSLNRDIILDDEFGAIYILPENTSLYNYSIVDNRATRTLNKSV